MLYKLSIANIKKSFKDYAIYFTTLILGVFIFYIFNSMDSQTAMLAVSSRQSEVIDLLIQLLSAVSIFVSFILGFLIIYASRFLIKKRNKDDNVDGILVQMPLPKYLDTKKIQNLIDDKKDVDGLSDINAGKLMHQVDCLEPCTPKGIMEILDYYKIPVEGKNVVIVGRSDLVGKPLAAMMLNKNATVTVAHSKTNNLKEVTKTADILVAAVGKKGLITEDMVKDDAVIIDVGINRVEDKLYGDVDFDGVKDKVSYITPVPGGVGQMTVASLGQNVIKAYQLRKK